MAKSASVKVVRPGIIDPAISVEDCVAAVAVVNGVATPQQAKHFADWIMREAARVQDLSFQLGGEEGRRATDFAEGRRFVGHLMRRLLQPETLAAAQLENASGSAAPIMSDQQAEQLTRGKNEASPR